MATHEVDGKFGEMNHDSFALFLHGEMGRHIEHKSAVICQILTVLKAHQRWFN